MTAYYKLVLNIYFTNLGPVVFCVVGFEPDMNDFS